MPARTDWAAWLAARRPAEMLCFVLGVFLPFFLVSHIGAYHPGDVGSFLEWSRPPFGDVYSTSANYPIMGILCSAGALRALAALFHPVDNSAHIQLLRHFLAAFEVIQFLLLGSLARSMGMRRPWLAALVVRLVPSSWVGGAVWAQIDGVTQVFLLGSLAACARAWQSTRLNRFRPAIAWLSVACLSSFLSLLTKQLAVFSMPWLCLGLLICSAYVMQRWRWRGLVGVVVALVVALVVAGVIDQILFVPDGFHGSSLLYAWGDRGNVNHEGKIAGNGFNLWVLLGRDMWSSSSVPFFTWDLGARTIAFRPLGTGHALFLAASALLLWLFVRAQPNWWGRIPRLADVDLGRLLTTLVFAVGLQNLALCVFLSGTHERYLYHGYFFLILAVLRLWDARRASGATLFAVLAAGTCYGGFVYAIMSSLPDVFFIVRRHEFQASLHLFLFFALAYVFWIAGRALPRPARSLTSQ
jgi:hypothetical protein